MSPETTNDEQQPSFVAKLIVRNQNVREFLAECFGIFILLTFGYASVAQFVMSGNVNTPLMGVNFAWGFAVSIAVWVTGGVSGGHINPAVTVALAIIGKFPWKKVPHYLLGQYIGAFWAAIVVFGVYYEAMEHFDGGTRMTFGENATAGIFTTFPKSYLAAHAGMYDQIVCTGLMMIGIMGLTDPRNELAPPPGMLPLCVGFLITCIGMCFCHNMGYPINPARDLPPRIFIAIAGWGKEPFSVHNYNYFWIPIVGPHLGAIVGAVIYELFIGIHLPDPARAMSPNKSNHRTSIDGFPETISPQMTPVEATSPEKFND